MPAFGVIMDKLQLVLRVADRRGLVTITQPHGLERPMRVNVR